MTTNFTSHLSIGGKPIYSPLVTVDELSAHLCLLHEFASLRARIDELLPGSVALLPKDKDKRWHWFVGFAVQRFSIWCSSLANADPDLLLTEEMLPPSDVLMVWHSYMLNPRRYAEDCIRVPALRPLTRLDSLLPSIPAAYWDRILSQPPLNDRIAAWKSQTSRPFDPLEDASTSQWVHIKCPHCNNAVAAPYLDGYGQGYLEEDFSVKCRNQGCQELPPITHAFLGMRRLIDDLMRNEGGVHKYLAGTLHTATNQKDYFQAGHLKRVILKSERLKCTEGSWIQSIFVNHRFSPASLLSTIRLMLSPERNGRYLAERVTSAYTRGDMFSLDLTAAVIRQGSFVQKMVELGWTNTTVFATIENSVLLQHAASRYHGFLNILSRNPSAFCVPTLDIDLAWHTHQLKPSGYNISCREYIGRYIDHDDSVGDRTLASGFDDTSRAWREVYQLPYTYHGEEIPGETAAARLNRLVQTFQLNPNHVEPRRKDFKDKRNEQRKELEKYMETYGKDQESITRRTIETRYDANLVVFLLPVPLDCSPPLPGQKHRVILQAMAGQTPIPRPVRRRMVQAHPLVPQREPAAAQALVAEVPQAVAGADVEEVVVVVVVVANLL